MRSDLKRHTVGICMLRSSSICHSLVNNLWTACATFITYQGSVRSILSLEIPSNEEMFVHLLYSMLCSASSQ